jgi:hypothetical protein
MNTADPVNTGPLDGFADEVAKRVTDGAGTRHVAQLLPEESPREPDRPDVWKDEGALKEWKRGLPERDTAVVFRVVYADSEPFENEVRTPNASDTDR